MRPSWKGWACTPSTMKRFLDDLAGRLEAIRAGGLGRALRDPEGIDFSSNDYLGLSRHPLLLGRLAERLSRMEGPPGSPASRLLRGNRPEHRALEERLARWKGTEAALLFPSGYQANLAVLTALLGPRDRALSDSLNHASLIDGLRLSGSRKAVFPHLDLDAAEEELRRPHPGGRTFLVTESLFSMDGDEAPLGRCADLAERWNAVLIVDDAHATGVHGAERGSGLVEEHGIEGRAGAIVSTFGKALGMAGAFVAGPRIVIDWLVNRARPFIFTTAPPPLLVAAIEVLLDLAAEEPERRGAVLDRAARLRAALEARGARRPPGRGAIVPVILGSNERALSVAADLQARGFDVRAIRPPSVPEGTARLRISVHADHSEGEIDALAEALAGALERIPAGVFPQAASP